MAGELKGSADGTGHLAGIVQSSEGDPPGAIWPAFYRGTDEFDGKSSFSSAPRSCERYHARACDLGVERSQLAFAPHKACQIARQIVGNRDLAQLAHISLAGDPGGHLCTCSHPSLFADVLQIA